MSKYITLIVGACVGNFCLNVKYFIFYVWTWVRRVDNVGVCAWIRVESFWRVELWGRVSIERVRWKRLGLLGFKVLSKPFWLNIFVILVCS